jgi:hypothetical protein
MIFRPRTTVPEAARTRVGADPATCGPCRTRRPSSCNSARRPTGVWSTPRGASSTWRPAAGFPSPRWRSSSRAWWYSSPTWTRRSKVERPTGGAEVGAARGRRRRAWKGRRHPDRRRRQGEGSPFRPRSSTDLHPTAIARRSRSPRHCCQRAVDVGAALELCSGILLGSCGLGVDLQSMISMRLPTCSTTVKPRPSRSCLARGDKVPVTHSSKLPLNPGTR